MILIAAVDSAWAIGKGGRLLVKDAWQDCHHGAENFFGFTGTAAALWQT